MVQSRTIQQGEVNKMFFQYNGPPLTEEDWFFNMWHVDSFCWVTWIFDPVNKTAYEWGEKSWHEIKPREWHPRLRANIMLLVCPD
jgi:hypothetical protein